VRHIGSLVVSVAIVFLDCSVRFCQSGAGRTLRQVAPDA